MVTDQASLTLDEFYLEEQARVLAFKHHWLQTNAVDPEAFPLKLSPGE